MLVFVVAANQVDVAFMFDDEIYDLSVFLPRSTTSPTKMMVSAFTSQLDFSKLDVRLL